jgi:hypothetical protein
MPKSAEREIKSRGGAVRYRSIDRDGKKMTCAITRKAGPQGGKTVCWPRESLARQILGEDESGPFDALDAAIRDGRSISITFTPQALETIRYFLEKPHHTAAAQKLKGVLERGLSG